MKKKITCFSPTNIQSIFAHSINFFKTSEGFSFNDLNVDIVCRDKFYPFGLKNLFSPIFKNKNINLIKMPYLRLFKRLNENERYVVEEACSENPFSSATPPPAPVKFTPVTLN